jgi:hypothetical protein
MAAHLILSPAVSTLRKSPIQALRQLSVVESDDEVVIQGAVSSWYHKQLAQETLLPLLGSRRLTNCVAVVQPDLAEVEDF